MITECSRQFQACSPRNPWRLVYEKIIKKLMFLCSRATRFLLFPVHIRKMYEICCFLYLTRKTVLYSWSWLCHVCSIQAVIVSCLAEALKLKPPGKLAFPQHCKKLVYYYYGVLRSNEGCLVFSRIITFMYSSVHIEQATDNVLTLLYFLYP